MKIVPKKMRLVNLNLYKFTCDSCARIYEIKIYSFELYNVNRSELKIVNKSETFFNRFFLKTFKQSVC